jgi:hypothetical protein
MKIKLVMIPPIGKETTIELSAAIFGGVLADGSNCPAGAYLGSMSFEQSLASLEHVIRAFIKLVNEQGDLMSSMGVSFAEITREEKLRAIKYLAQSVLDHSFDIEAKNREEDNVTLGEHIKKMRFDGVRKNE